MGDPNTGHHVQQNEKDHHHEPALSHSPPPNPPTPQDASPPPEKPSPSTNPSTSSTNLPPSSTALIRDLETAPSTSTSNTPPTYPEGGVPAYLVVLGSFTGLLAAFGLMNTIGTYQAYLSTHELSTYSSSSIGWIFSLYIFLAFFCGIQIGPVFDAKGPRWLVFAGSVCLVGGVLGLAEATEFWHFVLSFSIAAGLGTSLIFTPAVSAVAHWFERRRGNMSGLAATGGSVGGVVFPIVLPRLFDAVGFKWATRIAALVLAVLALVANLLIRSRLPPVKGGTVWPDFRIFGNRAFALTTAGVFFVEWGLFVPLAYLPSFALRIGVDPQFSYQLLAILNGASFFGRWLPGYMADRWGRFNTMILTVVLCLIAIVGLWLPLTILEIPSVPLLVLFSLLFGFASGSNISLTPVCIGQLCRTEEYGRWYATCYTIVSFGCLTGVPIAGALVSACGGGYIGLVAFTGACYFIGLVCFIAARGKRAGSWIW